MLASQWMNFIHLHVMSFGGVELELWLSWIYWFIENVNIWYCAMWTFMLHTCMTHDILLFVRHPTYVKSSQSKKINYKVVESKLKMSWNYVENKSKFM